jgi:hypothetical protein
MAPSLVTRMRAHRPRIALRAAATACRSAPGASNVAESVTVSTMAPAASTRSTTERETTCIAVVRVGAASALGAGPAAFTTWSKRIRSVSPSRGRMRRETFFG